MNDKTFHRNYIFAYNLNVICITFICALQTCVNFAVAHTSRIPLQQICTSSHTYIHHIHDMRSSLGAICAAKSALCVARRARVVGVLSCATTAHVVCSLVLVPQNRGRPYRYSERTLCARCGCISPGDARRGAPDSGRVAQGETTSSVARAAEPYPRQTHLTCSFIYI